MRVYGIARRTQSDPMHDEQPFCQGLTERRRTTVRFLGQQSEVTIDDTLAQAGEMRNLWKGITEFWRRHAIGRHLETHETSQQHNPALSQTRPEVGDVGRASPCQDCALFGACVRSKLACGSLRLCRCAVVGGYNTDVHGRRCAGSAWRLSGCSLSKA